VSNALQFLPEHNTVTKFTPLFSVSNNEIEKFPTQQQQAGRRAGILENRPNLVITAWPSESPVPPRSLQLPVDHLLPLPKGKIGTLKPLPLLRTHIASAAALLAATRDPTGPRCRAR
jgi:hypothetical protein